MKHRSLTALALAVSILVCACGGPSETDMLASARTYVDKQDYKGAVVQLKSLLQRSPQMAEARYLLGKALLEQGDAAGAALELRKALDLKFNPNAVVPALTRALLGQGEFAALTGEFGHTQLSDAAAQAEAALNVAKAHLAQKQDEQAAAAVQMALTAVPKHVGARLLQSRMLADGKNVPGARALLDQVLADDPKSAEAWMLKGEMAQSIDKDAKAALEGYRKAIELNPKLLLAHIAAVSVHATSNDREAMAAQVAEMKKAFPNHPRTKFFEADIAFTAKDYKAALEHIRPVVQSMPNNPLALQLAGAAEYRMGNFSQAETYLGKALQLAPDLPIARRVLAQVYLRTGQGQKTLQLLDPLLARNPSAAVLQMAAEAHLQSGESQKAEELYAKAAKLKPDDPKIRTALALSNFGKGKGEQAIGELEQIAASDSGAIADLALVSAHLRKREIDKALKAIDALEKKQPGQPLAPVLRGRVLAIKKDLEGAREQFQKALSLDRKYFAAVAGLAALDIAANKPLEARKHFDDLIKIDPTNVAAKQALANLLIRTGNTGDEPAKLIAEAAKQNPTDVRAQLALINFHLDRREAKQAIAAATDASRALVDHPDILSALGRAYLAANDTQQAISTFNRLAAAQPKSPLPLLGMAEANLALKDNEGAARNLKRALELDPKLIQAHRGLASLALADKQYDKALEIARNVQKLWPEDAIGLMMEGDAESARRNLKPALLAYQAALKKRGPQESATRVHGTMLGLGLTAEAEQFAQRWMSDNPQDPLFAFYLADRALAARDLPTAETRYRKVIELQPNNPLALNNIAWLMVQQNKPGAAAFAEKANRILPGRPPLMDTWALALAAEKQLPRALELQKEAVERAPDDGSLRMNLAKLYIQNDQKGMARSELEKLERMGRKYSNQEEVAKMLKAL